MPAPRAPRLTGSNFAYQHLRFDRFLDDAVALGRERLELWGIAPHLHIPRVGDAEARDLRRRIEERGLSAYCLTPEQVMYPVNVASPVGWLRAWSIALFRRAAEICAELGAEKLLLTPGRGGEDEPVDAAWRRSVDAIGGIAAYADTLGVTCVLEPLQRVESNLVNDSPTLAAMLDEIGAGRLGAVLDTVTMAVAGETVDDAFAALGDRIQHVHLVDGRPAGHLAWGDGVLPLDDYLRALRRHGYDGWMTFELFGDGTYALDPRAAVERCDAAVRRCAGHGPGE
ncbi:sugar phosphate isomerase/epimerase family protein [Streptomyces glaucescens]|uniref:AP endonuclease, family 2 n=1 Tax=Streptomyces glaucescens TaxID=1907 RepID=A0A089XJI8_STRGA|nr:sugar phosphate isomerase/epimerase family protein [Streptomyces glaucescens]AIS02147.1 AP endonuclease, family 2 [Streptomyces glaucescens]